MAAHHSYPPVDQREYKNTIVLFDVDLTLTIPRQKATPEMLKLLSDLRKKVAIGYVGGSNFEKQQDQLGDAAGVDVRTLFDYCFSENGLVAYKGNIELESNSFIKWLGDDKYTPLAKWILRYIADLDIPKMRGTFIEFRRGMINVSPIGRNASTDERNEYNAMDPGPEYPIRSKMVKAMREEFKDYGLEFSIGGQISFDVFPKGWDKTYVLDHHIKPEEFSTVHFFGDKTAPGGNDYEIYTRCNETKAGSGHSVKDPEDTIRQVKELFFPEGWTYTP